MTSVSEVPLVRVPPPAEAAGDESLGPTFSRWKALELPEPQRPSPVPLLALAILAGIAAMVLGGIALVSATRSAEEAPAIPPAKVARAAVGAESRVLALLANPSTDRVVFRASGGRLLLVVGSAGRAAILVRGFERAPAARPHYAWVVRSGRPVRAARFTGAERAVFLSVPVRHRDSVVVASERPVVARPGGARIVAVRG